MTQHLFDRICWASENLRPVEPKYRIVYENPDEPEAPVAIVCPAPEWLAMALHGGLLPPIEAYLRDAAKIEKYLSEGNDPQKFSWDKVGGAEHPYVEPIGPMTEEEAMEYLLMKDVPRNVWDRPNSNKCYFRFTRKENIEISDTYRNAWKIKEAA